MSRRFDRTSSIGQVRSLVRSARHAYVFGLAMVVLGLASSCATTLPFHGFADQATLDQKDQYVLKESSGGSLDPMNMAMEDQQYEHNKIAYNRVEEGYYQWGARMYKLGYRDIYYVRDLAPSAFRHSLIDTYDHAIASGFEDARSKDPGH